ncbi:MAG: hypothetical protein ABIW32_00205 [Terrimesophilobacter sp.]
MKSATSRFAVASVVALSLVLAGCAQTTSSGESNGSSGGTPAGEAGADCSVFAGQTDPELALFTSSAITAGPSEGQKYGDGTEFSVTLSQEAMDAGLLPQFEILSFSRDKGSALVSSLAFDPTTGGDGTFSTKTLAFGKDELVGKAVVAEIFAISDAKIDGTQQYGDKLLLGNYCITYANDGS